MQKRVVLNATPISQVKCSSLVTSLSSLTTLLPYDNVFPEESNIFSQYNITSCLGAVIQRCFDDSCSENVIEYQTSFSE